MIREQKRYIIDDLKIKMVFLVGPRQAGKTYLAREIAKEYKRPVYLNYDNLPDRKRIRNYDWSLQTDLLILDELHKMPKWKNFLKGLYDTKSTTMHLLVTGSAKLETYRQAGDSMAGRFFVHHLLPINLKELLGTEYQGDADRLLGRSGFPEPFLAQTEELADKWREYYIDSLLREDILEFADIEKFKSMKDVFEVLRGKVGSQISYENIANDVGISDKVVKRYIEIFEALYIIYTIKPYSKKINRSILKSPKVYFYDTGLAKVDAGSVFENLVANALQKHVHGLKDVKGQNHKLMYLRDKDGREVDFVIIDKNDMPVEMIEVKITDGEVSKSLQYFSHKYNIKGVQVVKNLQQEFRCGEQIRITPAVKYLEDLFL